jgi:hypothetical protein
VRVCLDHTLGIGAAVDQCSQLIAAGGPVDRLSHGCPTAWGWDMIHISFSFDGYDRQTAVIQCEMQAILLIFFILVLVISLI